MKGQCATLQHVPLTESSENDEDNLQSPVGWLLGLAIIWALRIKHMSAQ